VETVKSRSQKLVSSYFSPSMHVVASLGWSQSTQAVGLRWPDAMINVRQVAATTISLGREGFHEI
jgi:hypothetical protein